MTHQNDPPDVDFDAAYRTVPPWEVGRPQPTIEALVAAGSLVGPVLDVGCGTGENALLLAQHGLEVVALDASPAAIEQAREKAAARELEVTFLVADAYDLASVGRRFPTVIDSALLHIIGDRRRYAAQLAQVVAPTGRVILLEISSAAPIPYPKISEEEIRDAFGPPWQIESLVETTYDTHMGQFPAWFGVVRPG